MHGKGELGQEDNYPCFYLLVSKKNILGPNTNE